MAPLSISNIVVVATASLLLNASCSPVTATITRSHSKWQFAREQYSFVSGNNANNKVRKRNLVRGEAWVEQQQRGTETDNIFIHNLNDDEVTDEECSCAQRQRRTLVSGKCQCDDEGSSIQYIQIDDYYSSKSSKSQSTSESTSGKGSSSASESDYSDKSSKSKGSKKSKKSVKASAYDDDYIYPTRLPTMAPGPSIPPTNSPTRPPSDGRTPTDPPPTPRPTSRPTSTGPKCNVDSNGLYGEKVGISNEFRFLYTVQTIPTVTVPELNLDMLPKLEVRMGDQLLPKLFPGDCKQQGSVNAVSARSSLGNSRRLQQLASLNGMSIKPRDTVDEGAMCQGVDQTPFPCFVVEGFLTIFSSENLVGTERFIIENIISSTISSASMAQADNRFLTVSFQEFLESPPPGGDDDDVTDSWQSWIFEAEWWVLLLIALGAVIVCVCLLLICYRICRGRRKEQQQSPSSKQQASVPTDIEKVTPAADDSSGLSGGGRGASASDGYQYHSDDQINESLIPRIGEPIVEERQDQITTDSSQSNPLHTTSDQYNGVSYEDPIFQNNAATSYGDTTDYDTGGATSEDFSRSRTSPRHSKQSPSMYSSDIQSNPSRPISYREEIIEDDSSFEDVEEEYEIVYTSQSDRLGEDPNGGFYEEVFVDENDPATSNSNSNSHMNSFSNSGRYDSDIRSPESKDEDGFAHFQEQQQQQTSSFDSLRRKWET